MVYISTIWLLSRYPLWIYRWKRTWHIKLLLVFVILVGIIAYCNYHHLPNGLLEGGIGYLGPVYINTLARLFEFTLGMTMVLAYDRMMTRYRLGTVLGTITELLVQGMVITVVVSSSYNMATYIYGTKAYR